MLDKREVELMRGAVLQLLTGEITMGAAEGLKLVAALNKLKKMALADRKASRDSYLPLALSAWVCRDTDGVSRHWYGGRAPLSQKQP